MQKTEFPIAVVMQRRPARSVWTAHVWEPVGILPADAGGEARLLVDEAGVVQWLHPGFTLRLRKDEIDGYYFNVSAPEPRVFVLWRMEGESALPVHVTVSRDESARWLDGGHSVDGVAMPAEIYAWLGAHVEANYRPEPTKRIKPRSFLHPKDRT